MGKTIEGLAPSGARFVDGEDRDDYIGRPMAIRGARHEPNARYGPRWVVDAAMLDSGEAIALGLASNAYRDIQLAGVRDVLDAGDGIDPVVLFRDAEHNDAWAFRTATDAEVEAAGREAAGESEAETDEPAPAKGKGR